MVAYWAELLVEQLAVHSVACLVEKLADKKVEKMAAY